MTDVELALAWALGREHEPPGLAEAIDDLRHVAIAPPRLSYEERVQERIRLFEQCAEDFHRRHGTRPWVVAS